MYILWIFFSVDGFSFNHPNLLREYSLENVEPRWTTVWLLLGMVLKMARIIGLLGTPGVQAGASRGILGWSVTWQPRPVYVELLLNPLTQPSQAIIPLTLVHLPHLPPQSPLFVTSTMNALRAPPAAASINMASTALHGDAARSRVPPAARTTIVAALTNTPSATSMPVPAQWWVLAFLFVLFVSCFHPYVMNVVDVNETEQGQPIECEGDEANSRQTNLLW